MSISKVNRKLFQRVEDSRNLKLLHMISAGQVQLQYVPVDRCYQQIDAAIESRATSDQCSNPGRNDENVARERSSENNPGTGVPGGRCAAYRVIVGSIPDRVQQKPIWASI